MNVLPIPAPGRTSQSGVVLITAILMVALIAGVASSIGLGQQLWLRQTENLNERAQAESLRYSALGWIAMLLERDAKETKTDHLGELWAKQLPPLPAEGGMIAVKINDAQSQFNLNNLVRNGQLSPPDTAVFRKLLQAQGVNPAQIEPMIDALVDWIDSNSERRASGAEDVDYLANRPPYRPANQPLTSIDELRLVRGFTARIINALRPHVTVLPEAAPINVNTATEAVLAALLPESASASIPQLLRQRESQPFENTDKFLQLLPPDSRNQVPASLLSVKTGYFLVNIGIKTGRLERHSEALLSRPYGKPAKVIWNRLNPFVPEVKTDEKG